MLNSILFPGLYLKGAEEKSKQTVKKDLEAMVCGKEVKRGGTFLLQNLKVKSIPEPENSVSLQPYKLCGDKMHLFMGSQTSLTVGDSKRRS